MSCKKEWMDENERRESMTEEEIVFAYENEDDSDEAEGRGWEPEKNWEPTMRITRCSSCCKNGGCTTCRCEWRPWGRRGCGCADGCRCAQNCRNCARCMRCRHCGCCFRCCHCPRL